MLQILYYSNFNLQIAFEVSYKPANTGMGVVRIYNKYNVVRWCSLGLRM
jgi:hypothetical protein